MNEYGNLNYGAFPTGNLDVRVMASYRTFIRKRRLARVCMTAGVAILFCSCIFWGYASNLSRAQTSSTDMAGRHSHSALVPVSSDIGYMTDLDLRGFQVANDGKVAILRVSQ